MPFAYTYERGLILITHGSSKEKDRARKQEIYAAKELDAPLLPHGRGSAKVLSRAREQAAGLMPKDL
jgi:hypothetical protein